MQGEKGGQRAEGGVSRSVGRGRGMGWGFMVVQLYVAVQLYG